MQDCLPKSRRRILDAFRELVLSRPYQQITVGDIVERADVARSTFYEQFSSKQVLLCTSLEPLLDVLVRCARGERNEDLMLNWVNHFWENRSVGRVLLGSDVRRHVVDQLARDLARGADIGALSAVAAAEGLLGALHRWLLGEIPASNEAFAEWLMNYPFKTND